MPKPNEEIRKSIKVYEKALPKSERNPNIESEIKSIIERAAKPIVSAQEKPADSGGYSGKRTRSHKAGDTLG